MIDSNLFYTVSEKTSLLQKKHLETVKLLKKRPHDRRLQSEVKKHKLTVSAHLNILDLVREKKFSHFSPNPHKTIKICQEMVKIWSESVDEAQVSSSLIEEISQKRVLNYVS